MRSTRVRGMIGSAAVAAVVGALLLPGGATTPSASPAAPPESVPELLARAAAPAAARAASDPSARPVTAGTVTASRYVPGAVPLPRLGRELVPDPQGLARAKAQAAAWAASRPGSTAPTRRVGTAPTAVRSFNGIVDPESQPSDSTSAVSPTRFIEMVNSQFAIYSRTSGTPMQRGTLLDLTGCGGSSCEDNVFDPQVIWDAQTKRFYYVADAVINDSDNRLSFGFSRTANPGSNLATDWCRYNLGYGAEFPDYPKLGDSSAYQLIGVNTFAANGSFRGSDLVALSKPKAGTTAPGPPPSRSASARTSRWRAAPRSPSRPSPPTRPTPTPRGGR